MTLKKVKVDIKKIEDKFKPSKKIKSSEKTIWTENRLQETQKELFSQFRKCKKKCESCSHRKCDPIVTTMVNYLTPYGVSIYKRSFKHRSTLEEMSRVLTESINAQIFEIWHNKKKIHTSFGSMLRWKMVHFLDGKLNLFDKEHVQSMDQLLDSMDFNESSNSAGDDVIEYCSEAFTDATTHVKDFNNVIRKETIEMILKLMETSYQAYNRFLNSRMKYAIFIRTIYGVNRFLQGKKNFKLFYKRQQSQYYYTRLLDVIFRYLEEYKNMN